jgi:hypothetical protein
LFCQKPGFLAQTGGGLAWTPFAASNPTAGTNLGQAYGYGWISRNLDGLMRQMAFEEMLLTPDGSIYMVTSSHLLRQLRAHRVIDAFIAFGNECLSSKIYCQGMRINF